MKPMSHKLKATARNYIYLSVQLIFINLLLLIVGDMFYMQLTSILKMSLFVHLGIFCTSLLLNGLTLYMFVSKYSLVSQKNMITFMLTSLDCLLAFFALASFVQVSGMYDYVGDTRNICLLILMILVPIRLLVPLLKDQK
ncbi:hypothetical protein DOK78_000900 [Enterococcus sp. DIV2402]|uniref:Integral membrane protein n=1 Tax=Candidatus Enterococcus lowellii TaxID=2230877 RepID=A0ABZ2SK90_9ENTE|nr:hypothetical protein [Enterococcus sp. DIV2402]MBO0465767.1 hypothetical protein [Enterococcus sp. DIV2402]